MSVAFNFLKNEDTWCRVLVDLISRIRLNFEIVIRLSRSGGTDDILHVSPENLLAAWREFVRGKRHKRDVQEFGLRLMDNILELHLDLQNKTYRHGPYQHFRINDPKPRDIHKATVRDRLVHHAIHRVLYWFYHQVFIADAFSCRLGKGTHRAINRFRSFAYRASYNQSYLGLLRHGNAYKLRERINLKIARKMLG